MSLMFQMNVPKYLWSEAVLTAMCLINRMPSRILRMKSPVELLLGQREFKLPPRVCLLCEGSSNFSRKARPSSSEVYIYWVFFYTEGLQVLESGWKEIVCEYGCDLLGVCTILYK
jgi:hypothetical protein